MGDRLPAIGDTVRLSDWAGHTQTARVTRVDERRGCFQVASDRLGYEEGGDGWLWPDELLEG